MKIFPVKEPLEHLVEKDAQRRGGVFPFSNRPHQNTHATQLCALKLSTLKPTLKSTGSSYFGQKHILAPAYFLTF